MKPQLIPTDVPNPIDGGYLYVWAVPVSLWQRWLDFVRLAWFLWGADWDGPITLSTAIAVAWGLTKRKCRVVDHEAKPDGE